ncbi:WAT1-related protein At5g64700-like [Phoenix dactylifera]|uniref:WAT1-related protein n=1 Tax=Phoenix dactylifera TaxID=42345 RepID=A0A8B7BZP9_PHODC|nr:WAT1-related protein At5g64700-like [Phoenix dactylifera]
MGSLKGIIGSITLPLSMVLVQIFTMGMLILSKLALNQGMFIFALLAYRNAIGAVFVAPLAFFIERDMRKKLNGAAFLWIFINSIFVNLMGMGLYYYGLRDTSASYAVNFLNSIPVVTFICAIILRVERLGLGSRAGKMKILGTLVCVGGTMVASLYKGKALHLFHHILIHTSTTKGAKNQNMMHGTVFLIASCLGYAFWFLTQVKLFKVFPSKYWTTMLTCVAGCFQSMVAGVIIDRGRAEWSLKWNLQLATIIYSGILNTGAAFCMITWAVSRRGPTYPPMFNSLSVIFTVAFSCFFMGQDVTIGSLLGTCSIVVGLYAFLWGQKQELLLKLTKVGNVEETSNGTPA